jgi:hypothetical protein
MEEKSIMEHNTAMATLKKLLPPGQPVISTTNLRRTHAFVRFLFDYTSTAHQPTIGLVHGSDGSGKSVAVANALVQSGQKTPMVSMPFSPTPSLLVRQILVALGAEARSRQIADMVRQITEVVRENDVQLVCFDDVEQADAKVCNFLRFLQKETHCSLLLVASLNKHIYQYKRLLAFMDPNLEFYQMDEQEAVQTFFPNLVLPHWHIDPTNDADKELCWNIWECAEPSLRRARTIAQMASQIASYEGAPNVTIEHVDAVRDLLAVHKQNRQLKREDYAIQQPEDGINRDKGEIQPEREVHRADPYDEVFCQKKRLPIGEKRSRQERQ